MVSPYLESAQKRIADQHEIDLTVWAPFLDALSPGWRDKHDCLSVDDEQRALLLRWAVADELAHRGDPKRVGRSVLANKAAAVKFCYDVRERWRRLVNAAHIDNIRDKVRDQLANDRGCYD